MGCLEVLNVVLRTDLDALNYRQEGCYAESLFNELPRLRRIEYCLIVVGRWPSVGERSHILIKDGKAADGERQTIYTAGRFWDVSI